MNFSGIYRYYDQDGSRYMAVFEPDGHDSRYSFGVKPPWRNYRWDFYATKDEVFSRMTAVAPVNQWERV